jgi:D-glycero-D-manno-heptose 1,7-bisphosphate phosphatase
MRAILLDRDGVINREIGHIKSKSQFKFLPQVFETLRYLKSLKIRTIIVTNQSVVGRGIITSRKLKSIHKYMCNAIEKNGGKIEKIYHCSYHPIFGLGNFKKNSFNRKPNPGMIIKAKKKFNLNKKNCFMIGDKKTDKIAAKRANIKFFYKKKLLLKQVKNILKKF